MLKLSAGQMAGIEQRTWFSRLARFIQQRCLREDFRQWAADHERLQALWLPLWQARGRLSEHDLALVMVVAAVAHHERRHLGAAARVLADVRAKEVPLKCRLADLGYFHFTAFDVGAPAGAAATGAVD